MIRVIGFIFIIFSSSAIGYILGSKFALRVRQINFMKVSLQMLETEIVYSNTPLPEALENVGRKSAPPVKDLFEAMSAKLKTRYYSTVGEAFSCAIDEVECKMALNKEDTEIMKSFGCSIGNSDVEGQIKSFRMAIKQLDEQQIKAEELRGKSEKMYKNLGLLSGLAIVILLL